VRVDDVALLMAMACHMKLHHAVARHAAEELVGRETVVEGAHINVVDVEQQPAIGAACNLAYKLPFGHLRLAEGHVARHVLEREPATEKILHPADAFDDARPAQMIGDPLRLHALPSFFKAPRYSKSSGAVEAIESDTPCITSG
jgi:hypothetical protein